MDYFRSKEIKYDDIIQLDGALSIAHINYGKTPLFCGKDATDIAKASRKNSYSSLDYVENVYDQLFSFNGTDSNGLKSKDRLELWKAYWFEYISAFGKMSEDLPQSVVTAYIGRHAIEIGFKYLLLKEINMIKEVHQLGELADLFFSKVKADEQYMENVHEFCNLYSKYIEGGNAEYFRFPDYKKNAFFSGNHLDIEWLSYSFTLILLKMLHFVELDEEYLLKYKNR